MMSKKKIIGIAAIATGIVILVLVVSHKSQEKSETTQVLSTPHVDEASGDTNSEVLRQLTAQLKVVQKDNTAIRQQLVTLQSKNKRMDDNALRKLINDKLNSATQDANVQIERLEREMTLLTKDNSNEDSEIGGINSDGIIISVPDLREHYPVIDANNTLQKTTNSIKNTVANATDKIEPIPIYTIPAIANLASSTLMTALIGEVPNNGQLVQPPFPFEAIVGEHDLLGANGVTLPPELHGIKVYGYSVGVGSFLDGLSCARAYITKVLFIFKDGHFAEFGDENQSSNSVNPSNSLGYLTDQFGNPCIPGKYITNMPRVLTALLGVGTVSGAASALAQAQTSTINTDDGTSTTIDGDLAKFALGSGLSYSTQKGIEWMLDRLKSTFDVVYIPASKNKKPTTVVINIIKTIPINYDPDGRQLHHEDIPYALSNSTVQVGLD